MTLLLVKVLKKVFFQEKYKFPPGPPALPLIGNVQMLGRPGLMKNLDFADAYGDMHTITLFGRKQVVISSMEALRECNLEHSDTFNHRPTWMKALVNFSPGIIFRGIGRYEANKKFVSTNLKKHGMGKSEMESRIINEIEDVMSLVERAEPLNPLGLMETYSANVICYLCFGKTWPYEKNNTNVYQEALKQMHKLSETLILADFLSFLKVMPAIKSKFEEYKKKVNVLRDLGRRTLQEKQDKDVMYGLSFESFDLADDFLADHNNNPTQEAIKNFEEIAQDMFTAGVLTTAATLTFSIIQLVNKPIVQEKLFMEIKTYLGDRNEATMSDIKNLPYMEGFMHEILRVYPAVPFIPHAIHTDTKLRDFYLPAGTYVAINSCSINNNPNIFPNPNEFDPSRWLDHDGMFKTSMKDQIITFGKGKRSCIGKSLARMEIFLMLIKLLRKYKLGVPKGAKLPSCTPYFDVAVFTPDDFELEVTIREY